MHGPFAHTDPAKLILALFARHVVTSSILFNRRRALGTLFRVCGNPICSLGIVGTLLEPQFDNGAYAWLMIRIGIAAKAELVTACALHSGNDVVQGFGSDAWASDGILAVWRRAPTEGRVVIDVAPVEQFAVPRTRVGESWQSFRRVAANDELTCRVCRDRSAELLSARPQ